jgi:20S proteasome subunit beta 7
MSFHTSMDECPPLWYGGPDPVGNYAFPQKARNKIQPMMAPRTRTMQPMTTGTSVFGIKYKDGVVLAADTLGSYGSLARYTNIQRVIRVNDSTMIACTGDYADFQFLTEIIEQKQVEEEIRGGGETMKPKALHTWLTTFLYNRRSKFNPLWTTLIVGGIDEEKPYLGVVNYIGMAYTENAVSTGMGHEIGVPMMRDVLEKKDHTELTLEEAKAVVVKCLRTCFYRDCRQSPRYHIAVVNKEGAVVEDPKVLETNWEIAHMVAGYE